MSSESSAFSVVSFEPEDSSVLTAHLSVEKGKEFLLLLLQKVREKDFALTRDLKLSCSTLRNGCNNLHCGYCNIMKRGVSLKCPPSLKHFRSR
mmetsp:Transcript_12377/g.23745  ORF Transcript_12377/g.23745 Transcript_12377/m.23745 type:complete len:93 (-) Transcript_12377:10-288(-)